jgi:hypothetical protein
MPLTFQKFNAFALDCILGKHRVGTDVYKMMLTNTAPVAANSKKADLVEITAGGGYTAGGKTITIATPTQTGGVAKVIAGDDNITCTSGTIGPYRYMVLYNDTHVDDPLVCFFDNGVSLTLYPDHKQVFDFDDINGLFQIS